MLKSFTTHIEPINPAGDAMVRLPKNICNETDLRRGDLYVIEHHDTKDDTDKRIIFKRAVRLSRFRREMNKYRRRIEKYQTEFIVLRNDEEVFVLLPGLSF